METVLQVEGLFGGYFPHKPVLKNISFHVARGEMVGLIGLNGAGKSTTIKHILGLLRPTCGSIRILGRTLSEAPEPYRTSLGYVPETPELYEELTIREHLKLTGMAYGLDEAAYQSRTDALLETFRMNEHADKLSGYLSKGMRQKAMLMNAFLAEPPLYVIDEPFLGLDPFGIRSLLDLMAGFKSKGAGFLISSHILSTLEHYCDRYVILHQGLIAAQGTLAEIRHAAGLPEATLDELFYRLISLARGGCS